MTAIATQILSVLTILAQAISVFLLVALLARRRFAPQLKFFGDNAIIFSFVAALIAMSGSLFYSEVAGYAPCTLCWYQRILMYPQVFLLGLALLRKSRDIIPYALLLSGIGAVIAGYHYLLQIGIAPELPCAATGYSAACSQRFILTFGYITIPMMAFSAFALIVLLMLVSRRKESNLTAS